MAVTETEYQVQWAAANTKAVATVTEEKSDVITFAESAFAGTITLKAFHNATPGAGDTVDFYLIRSTGDPDGSGSDEYPADRNDAEFLANCDCNTNDPAIKTVDLPLPVHTAKIAAYNNAGESITVSANIRVKTA